MTLSGIRQVAARNGEKRRTTLNIDRDSYPSSVPVGRFCPVNTIFQRVPDGLIRSMATSNLP